MRASALRDILPIGLVHLGALSGLFEEGVRTLVAFRLRQGGEVADEGPCAGPRLHERLPGPRVM